MGYCLKGLLVLAAIPLFVAATNREATATDRFDVIVDVVTFKSLKDMDPSKGNSNDEYFLTVRADIVGEGRRSIINLEKTGPAKKTLYVGRQIRFRNIKTPDRPTVYLSSDVSEEDVVEVGTIFKKKKEKRYANMGIARGATTGDLFREADRSRDDVASQTVTISNRNYRMEIRVRVIEVD